jgi:hypothetical protein
MKKYLLAAATGAAAFMAVPASAAITVDTSVPAGTFADNNVACSTGTTNCSFTTFGTFTTPTGYTSLAAQVGSTLTNSNPATNLDFISAFINNSVTNYAFTINPNGQFERGTLGDIPLIAGALNTISVTGTAASSTNGSLSGQLSFGTTSVPGVPEPATWAMMLFGFGGVGFAMRRRKASDKAARVRVAYA